MLVRVLLLVLLAMNLGVAAWWWLRAPPVEAPMAAADPGVPSLALLSEREADEAGRDTPDEAEVAGPPEPLPAPLARECLALGPWLTQVDLRRAMNVLTPIAARIQYRETREVIRRGYRVFLPSPGSREAALGLARQLSARGLSDYYVVTAGEAQNSVSLGLYRDENNARTRLDQVRAQGFDAQLEPRNDELPKYWIDVDLPQGAGWRELLGRQGEVGSQPIPCGE